MTVREFGVKRRIDVVPNFVDTRQYRPDGASAFARGLARDGRGAARARLELPPGQAHRRRARDLRPRRSAGCRRACSSIGDGPERSLAERLAREGGFEDRTTFLGNVAGDRDDPAGRAPAPAALRRRVVRPRGARGDGVRRAGRSARPPAACPRSSRTGRAATSGPSATSRAWRRRRSRCSRTRRSGARSRRTAGRRAEQEFPTDGARVPLPRPLRGDARGDRGVSERADSDARRVPAREGRGEVREKASRFFGIAARASSAPREAEAFVARRARASITTRRTSPSPGRSATATSASRRASDAGEPSGTAGRPIARRDRERRPDRRRRRGRALLRRDQARHRRSRPRVPPRRRRALAAAGRRDRLRDGAPGGPLSVRPARGSCAACSIRPTVRLVAERFDPEPVLELEVRRSRAATARRGRSRRRASPVRRIE